MIMNANMSSPQMMKLAEKLWRKTQQNPKADAKLMVVSCIRFFKLICATIFAKTVGNVRV